MRDRTRTSGAIALAASGVAAAFSLAACCAIPIALATAGLGASWLSPMVSVTQPYAGLLTAASLAALIGSVLIVWRASGHCGPGSMCARPGFRWGVTGAAAIGAALLLLSRIYG